MCKKIISVILALSVILSCFSMAVSARQIGVGGGAESFNPVEFSQDVDAIGNTKVDVNFVTRITDNNYKVKINSVSAKMLFLAEGDTSALTVAYETGTVVDDETKFSVTGHIETSTNSAVRYTVSYDILDKSDNTVWKNLTGYAYGKVSGSVEVTGAIGTTPDNPGKLDDGAYFTSIDKLNSCYVQVPSAALLYELKTQHFLITFRSRRSETQVVSGNAPSTLRTYPVDWPSVQWYRQEKEGTWLMWATPESDYYNFTIDMNANDESWEDQSNTVLSTEMYYLDAWDRANAKTVADKILGLDNVFNQGFYVQKGRYTEESWENFLAALDMAHQVMLAVPGANYGFKIACQNGAKADDNLNIAFDNLLEAPCDWTTYKDPIAGEQSTCGSGGTQILTCICGKTMVEATNTSSCKPSDEWTVILEPTCLNKGEEAQLCTMCSNPVNRRDVEPLGHKYTTSVVLPDCVGQGYTIYTCDRCSYTYNDNFVDPLGHTSGEVAVENVIEATCTTEGSYDSVVYCAVCDAEISRETMKSDVIPHISGEWKVVKEPDVRQEGIEALCCAVCDGIMERRSIPGLEPYFRAAEGSDTVVDEERGIIYGLEEYITDLEGYVEYKGGTVEYIETENGFGTGTIVNYIVDDAVRDTYKIVIYGDVTGDGFVDTSDAEKFAAIANFEIEPENEAVAYAADIKNFEGVADTYDLAEFYAVAAGETTVLQNPEYADDYVDPDVDVETDVAITTVLNKEEVAADEVITASIRLESEYYITNMQIPVIFDKTKFELVDAEAEEGYLTVSDESTFKNRNYVINGKADCANGFEMTSDDAYWNTEASKEQFGCAYITAVYDSSISSEDTTYAKPQNEIFVTFRLKALENIEDSRQFVFVDTDWAKTEENKDGLLAVGMRIVEDHDVYQDNIPFGNITYNTSTITVKDIEHTPSEKFAIENNVAATCSSSGSFDAVIYCTCCTPAVELSRETIDIGFLDHTPGETVKENEVPATATQDGSYDSVVYCAVCGEEVSRETVIIPVVGVKVSGTVTSFDDGNAENSDDITIGFFAEGSDEAAYVTTVTGYGKLSYELEGVLAGTYTVVVSKANHVTREYTIVVEDSDISNDMKIHLNGDITGDGKVNTMDVARANAHAKKVSELAGYEARCADINNDGKVNTMDVARINAHAKKVSTLW